MLQLKNINFGLFIILLLTAVYVIYKARKKDVEEYSTYVEKCKTCTKSPELLLQHKIYTITNPPGKNTFKILSNTCNAMLKGGMSGALIGGPSGALAQGIMTGIVTLVHSGTVL